MRAVINGSWRELKETTSRTVLLQTEGQLCLNTVITGWAMVDGT